MSGASGSENTEYTYGGPPPSDIPRSPVSGVDTTSPAAPPTDAPPAPLTPTVPPPPTPPTGPNRRMILLAVVAVVVVVIVVVAVLALGLFSGSGGGSNPIGAPATYDQTVPLAEAQGQSANGGPWTVVAAEGLGFPDGISAPNFASFGGSDCTYTPVTGGPSTVVLPGTAAGAGAGAVATWVYFAKNVALNAILFIEVSNGVAVPIITATGSNCVGTFTDLGAVNAISAVDSGTIAAALDTAGGSSFLTNHTGATQLFVLLGASAADDGVSVWSASYSTCAFTATSGSGSEITALFNATSGTLLSGPTTQSTSC